MKEKAETIRKRKVLIFEDDAFLTDIYTKNFREFGFEVKGYDNYVKPFVVDVVAEENPDIIYCDIVMPGMDGWEAIKLLKKDKRTKNIPIIVVDNMCGKEEIQKGFDAGASDFLCKSQYTPSQVVIFFKNYLETLNSPGKNFYGSGGTYKRGVFVIVRRLSSGADDYVVFMSNSKAQRLTAPTGKYDLAIFNEFMFASWYLVNLRKELKQGAKGNLSADDTFFILEILDQARWDFVCNSLLFCGDTTAVLNPCEAKDHQCPIYRFNLKDESDFNKLKEWFSKCPNGHYTFKGQKKGSTLLLLEKPNLFIDKNNNSIEEIKENIQKLPRLTKEEMAFFLKKDVEFFKHFNLQWPLWRKIASALQSLAVAKLLGIGYAGIDVKNEKEAVEHHLKACLYDPEIAYKNPNFRKIAGLPVYKINQ